MHPHHSLLRMSQLFFVTIGRYFGGTASAEVAQSDLLFKPKGKALLREIAKYEDLVVERKQHSVIEEAEKRSARPDRK